MADMENEFENKNGTEERPEETNAERSRDVYGTDYNKENRNWDGKEAVNGNSDVQSTQNPDVKAQNQQEQGWQKESTQSQNSQNYNWQNQNNQNQNQNWQNESSQASQNQNWQNQSSQNQNQNWQNQSSQNQNQNWQNESSQNQNQSWQNQNSQNQYSNGPSYKAPEYHFSQNDTQNQGFHNEYQDGNNGYYTGSTGNNGNGKKPGGTAKKVAIIAGCAVVLGVVAAVGFKGIDMLVNGSQNNTALIEERNGEQEQTTEASNAENDTEQADSSNTDSSVEKTTIGAGSDETTVISDIAEEMMKSMVSIDCTVTETYSDYFGRNYSQDETGSGSGFVIGESDTELFIATNNHVVEGANDMQITFIDETTAEGTTKGTDSSADLAVVSVQKSDLKKTTLKAIKIASLGDSDEVRLGERVVAIGNALGYGQSVTVGYISAKDREVELDDNETMVLLQTDAAINPGNSGGALINLKGEVIGIPNVKYADSSVEGMGFAIPISRATPILDELMNREVLTEEEQGYLGVSCLDVTSDATVYGIPVGVYVSEVSDDGAAKEAGIQVGDIITAVNGVETTSKEALVEKVRSYRIGTEITITLQRSNNGTYKEMEVTAVLKDAGTIDGLSGSDKDSDSKNSGNSGSSGKSGKSGSSDSDDSYGNSDDGYGYYYGDDGSNSNSQDFYDFFNNFFN